jgi:hypothetical protein
MTTSEQVHEIATALAAAQAAMRNATLNRVNPHFRSKYADLAEIRETVVPHLATHGIAVVQTLGPGPEPGALCVITRLLHTSGQWIQSLCPLPAVADMQKLGSAITYARRYSLSAICVIAADEDDDANAAVTAARQTATPIPAPPGVDAWLQDLTAVADQGTRALEAAWKASPLASRKYLMATNAPAWESLKARAAAVTAREAEAPPA